MACSFRAVGSQCARAMYARRTLQADAKQFCMCSHVPLVSFLSCAEPIFSKRCLKRDAARRIMQPVCPSTASVYTSNFGATCSVRKSSGSATLDKVVNAVSKEVFDGGVAIDERLCLSPH